MLSNIYNQTVTILNKLKREDSKTGLDVWYKTTITDVAWYTDSARSAGGSTVFIGTYITVLIPFHEQYMPYIDWKNSGLLDSKYTMSTNDYIILGEVKEDITPDNLIKTLKLYGENVCQVKHHNSLYDRFGATVQLKVEGV